MNEQELREEIAKAIENTPFTILRTSTAQDLIKFFAAIARGQK
jgi:hypothetical protein